MEKGEEISHIRLLCSLGELSWIFHDAAGLDSFLQNVVTMVADHMQAEVCSIYLYDAGADRLTLRATRGLNPEAVGRVTLRSGEGLVGLALRELRPICENAASGHPNFKFFAGIREEEYDSFLAVPILKGIQRVGVLVVQRPATHPFNHQDIQAMKAVGSQLANIVANARLLLSREAFDTEAVTEAGESAAEMLVKGKPASGGHGLGPAFVHERRPSLAGLQASAFDGAYTLDDFRQAVRQTEQQLETLQAQVEEKLSDVASLIFTAHLLMLHDEEFVGAMEQRIREGESVAAAVLGVAEQFSRLFEESGNPAIQEKVQDIEDLALRLLGNLAPDLEVAVDGRDGVVIARDLLPSAMLKLSSENVRGIVLASGGVTSHLSILARSLRIPLVIADRTDLLTVADGTPVLVDGDAGNVYLNPTPDVLKPFREKEAALAGLGRQERPLADPTETADGVPVRLMANINLLSDVTAAREVAAHGVGLYRTEFPFLVRAAFPSEEEQYVVYRKLVEGLPGRPVTFRTLDIGGDKVLPYYPSVHEQNPFLGMRSIRFSLTHQEVFRQQIRAILRAGLDAEIRIMFPMVTSVEEFREARDLVNSCSQELTEEGAPHNTDPAVGMMVEIPSVMELIADFAQEADFFSIGTNDFIQYMLAVDRTNETVAALYVPHHPSVLRGLRRIVEAAKRAGKPVSVCGDMAHEARYVRFLLGIGVRELSADPGRLQTVRDGVETIDTGEAAGFAHTVLGEATVAGVERVLDSAG